MALVELLPLVGIGTGGIIAGAAAIVGGTKLASLFPKQREKIQAKQNQQNFEALLTRSESYEHKLHTNMLRSTPADGKYLEFPTSYTFKRDTSDLGKRLFESHFKDLPASRGAREEVYSSVYDLLHYLIRFMTREQLIYFQKDFEREVRKRLQAEMAGIGLEITNFELKCDTGYDAVVLDLESLSGTSFESIKTLFPAPDSAVAHPPSMSPANAKEGGSSDGPTLSPDFLSERLNALEDSWMEYEINPILLLNYPLMSDASCQETAAFFVSMNRVKSASAAFTADKGSIEDFSSALEAAELAFVKAENNAKKMRYSHLTQDQRQAIEKARPLVAMYKNEAASPHERLSAYKQASNRLEGIMALPERPIMGLLESVDLA